MLIRGHNISGASRYGVAALVVALAIGVRLLLLQPAPNGSLPLLIFTLAVIASACYGGLGPGLLTTALSALAGAYLFVEPYHTLFIGGSTEQVRLVLFILIGALVSLLAQAMRTARRRTEENRLALRRTEKNLRLMVDSVQDYAIFAIDLDGHITNWNSGVERVLGYEEDEIVGRHFRILFSEEDIAAGQPEAELERARREGRGGGERWHVKRDGARFWATGAVHPSYDDCGKLVGYVKVMRDNTERKRLEQALAERAAEMAHVNHRLAEANQVKDEFLATLSHELRTPLTSILGWSSLLRSGKLDAEAAGQGLETIRRNAIAQTRLVDDLLDVSRIITGKLSIEPRKVTLAGVIEAATDAVRLTAEAKNIHIESSIDDSVGAVSGDANRLQQVVWNLLSNAIKFTPPGGRVRVRLAADAGSARISVTDTGSGIAPEFLSHVFDRFRQADSSTTRTHGGLGLGLAIVRHLVELHGGVVQVESAGLGHGATFIVRLPVATSRDNAQADAEQIVTDGAADGGQFPLADLSVLVVDDEPDTRKLLAFVLTKRGAQVSTAGSAAEGLEALRREHPDVLVSDIGMPEEDGYSFITEVRKLPREQGGGTPAVALTAYARVEDRLRAVSAGYQIHIPKPIEPTELVSTVANLAGRGSEHQPSSPSSLQ